MSSHRVTMMDYNDELCTSHFFQLIAIGRPWLEPSMVAVAWEIGGRLAQRARYFRIPFWRFRMGRLIRLRLVTQRLRQISIDPPRHAASIHMCSLYLFPTQNLLIIWSVLIWRLMPTLRYSDFASWCTLLMRNLLRLISLPLHLHQLRQVCLVSWWSITPTHSSFDGKICPSFNAT